VAEKPFEPFLFIGGASAKAAFVLDLNINCGLKTRLTPRPERTAWNQSTIAPSRAAYLVGRHD